MDIIELIPIIHKYQICEFVYSLEFICKPQINTFSQSFISQSYAQCSQLRQNKGTLYLLVSALIEFLTSVLFTVYSVAYFSQFLLVISQLKMYPSIRLNCFLVFLSTRRLGCALQRERMLNKLHSGVS